MGLKSNLVITTGASSRIGKAMPIKFVEEVASVVLCARNEDKLKHLKEKIERDERRC